MINQKDVELTQLTKNYDNLKREQNLEKATTENKWFKKAFFGLMVTNFILGAGYVLFPYRHLIKNGFVSLWQLKNEIPSVSFKKPNISFPTFSNPFSNFQIGNQIALYWALLRNRFGV